MENKFEDSMQNVIGNQNYELSENSGENANNTIDKVQSQLHNNSRGYTNQNTNTIVCAKPKKGASNQLFIPGYCISTSKDKLIKSIH